MVEHVIFSTYLHTCDSLVVSSHLFKLLTCCFAFLTFPSLPHSQLNFSPKLAELEYVPFLYKRNYKVKISVILICMCINANLLNKKT